MSKLNSPINKVWYMVRKITGKNKYPTVKQLKHNGNDVTNTKDISNTLAETISNNSSTENYSYKF